MSFRLSEDIIIGPSRFKVRLTPEFLRVATLGELDALVGDHVSEEQPEVFWEDSHGCFQFHSEVEALRALADPYFQRFLPDVDWRKTAIREVRLHRRFSVDAHANWDLAEKAIARFGPLLVWREVGRWHAAFGSTPDAEARNPLVVVCLASLSAAGVRVQMDHNRIDSELNQTAGAMEGAGRADPMFARGV